MKVLIVSALDNGGAGTAAYRLHKALLKNNINSFMLVMHKTKNEETIFSAVSKKDKLFSILSPHIDAFFVKKYNPKSLFSPAINPFNNFVDIINDFNADIVHLHWINQGMIRIEDIAKIKAKVVWTMHDMWAFTGGCHYSDGCNKFEIECQECKIINSNKKRDLSNKVFYRKIKTFKNIDMTIVGVSRWITDLSRNSKIFENKSFKTIANCIDTNFFKPVDKKFAKKMLGLDENKRYILFGAIDATSDKRKGFDKLKEALNKLNLKKLNSEVVIFGSNSGSLKANYLGYFNDYLSLVLVYNIADVMIVPSKEESFGQTAIEAMSCKIPVVAFKTSGLLDIVEHKKNGYLAQPFKSFDLADGIEWILNLDKSEYNRLCNNAREKILKEFDNKIIAKKYEELYNSLMIKKQKKV